MRVFLIALLAAISYAQTVPDCDISSERCNDDIGPGGWRAFWWYFGRTEFPSNEVDVLAYDYGSCDISSTYCFGRIPSYMTEDETELLAVDSTGNQLLWRFDSTNPTAHAAWQAFAEGIETPAGAVVHAQDWNPTALAGTWNGYGQDSWQYREQNGVKSFILDDDNCDCLTTLSAGHGLCGESHSTSYGPANEYGVDLLNDPGCNGPSPTNGLNLYVRSTTIPSCDISTERCNNAISSGWWRSFWWYVDRTEFPMSETDVIAYDYGTCDVSSDYCFGRIPSYMVEDETSLLAIDSAGNHLMWDFDSSNPTAHAVWQAFASGIETAAGSITHSQTWNPTTLAGTWNGNTQDSWQYRVQNGVKSFLLDDDNCDCLSTLSAGHGMCGSGHSTSYGPANEYGVDLLHDPGCNGPSPSNGLSLFIRPRSQPQLTPAPICDLATERCNDEGWRAFWWYVDRTSFPTEETDVLAYDYGSCDKDNSYCFGRIPAYMFEDDTELLAVDSAGNELVWQFDLSNPTAHAAWQAFSSGIETPAGTILHNQNWNPTAVVGTWNGHNQDSWQYREQNGVKSFILDDDNCDCLTTLSAGHGLCGDGHSTSYGPANEYGVDLLHDPGCNGPSPTNGLTLYVRSKTTWAPTIYPSAFPRAKIEDCRDETDPLLVAAITGTRSTIQGDIVSLIIDFPGFVKITNVSPLSLDSWDLVELEDECETFSLTREVQYVELTESANIEISGDEARFTFQVESNYLSQSSITSSITTINSDKDITFRIRVPSTYVISVSTSVLPGSEVIYDVLAHRLIEEAGMSILQLDFRTFISNYDFSEADLHFNNYFLVDSNQPEGIVSVDSKDYVHPDHGQGKLQTWQIRARMPESCINGAHTEKIDVDFTTSGEHPIVERIEFAVELYDEIGPDCGVLLGEFSMSSEVFLSDGTSTVNPRLNSDFIFFVGSILYFSVAFGSPIQPSTTELSHIGISQEGIARCDDDCLGMVEIVCSSCNTNLITTGPVYNFSLALTSDIFEAQSESSTSTTFDLTFSFGYDSRRKLSRVVDVFRVPIKVSLRDYYCHSPNGKLSSVKTVDCNVKSITKKMFCSAEGWEDLTSCASGNHFDFHTILHIILLIVGIIAIIVGLVVAYISRRILLKDMRYAPIQTME